MQATMSYRGYRNEGFTLTELAIVMVIMALLIGGMMLPLSAQQDIRNNAETTRQLDEIREALLGFAITRGYFPCPATSTSNGVEDRNAGSEKCTANKRYGLLPWVTLGLRPSDSWNHLFIYSVTPAFSHGKPADRFTMTTSPDITIRTRDADGNLENISNNNDIPLVVLSTGKNGHQSWTLDQVAQNADSTAANPDEDTNASSADGRTFISRTPTDAASTTGEFDDLVAWVSPNVLFNRMVAAGKLP